MKQTCETCRYRLDRGCRRYPPQRGFWGLLVQGFGVPNSEFPDIKPDQWCGEYQEAKP